MKEEIHINTDMLSWAIECAGYSNIKDFETTHPELAGILEKKIYF